MQLINKLRATDRFQQSLLLGQGHILVCSDTTLINTVTGCVGTYVIVYEVKGLNLQVVKKNFFLITTT